MTFMNEELRDLLGMFVHSGKIALAQVGRRASVSAIKSVSKDARTFVGGIEGRLARFIDKLEDTDDPPPPRSKSGAGYDYR